MTSSPLRAVALATVFAEISAVGGLLLSLAPGLPVSVFVTTISFVIYLICRVLTWAKGNKAQRDDIAAHRARPTFHASGHPAAEAHHTSEHDETCDHR